MAVARARDAIDTDNSTVTTPAFATLPGSGSAIVLFIAAFRVGGVPSVVSIADTGLNTYTLVTARTRTNSTLNWYMGMYIAENITPAAATHTVTVTMNTSTSSLCAVIAEYTGVPTSGVINVSGNAGGSSTTPSLAVTTDTTNCMLVAGVTGAKDDNPVVTTPANETTTLIREQENNSTAQMICTGDLIAVTAASHTGGFTIEDTDWDIVVAALEPADAVSTAVKDMIGQGRVPYRR